jgi:hypothetical protein
LARISQAAERTRYQEPSAMRFVFTLILGFHGLIHVLGAMKWSGAGHVPQLTGRTLCPLSPPGEQIFAALWLLVVVALLSTAALYVLQHDSWWIVGLASVVLSQTLIVVAWPDAKFGTIPNVLILIAVLSAGARSRFEAQVAQEVRAMLAKVPSGASAIAANSEISALPAPVRPWIETSGAATRPRARTVRLRQRGDMRAALGAPWMPVVAEQYFTLDDPAFVWRVDATLFGFFPFAGRDSYSAGHGRMLIKAASLLNVVDASDDKIAHGAMLRYLAESIWFPSAALSPLIQWEAIDAAHAKATLHHAGRVAEAVFSFDDHGHVLGIRAERYLGGGIEAKLTPWVAVCSEWQRMEGIEVPTRGEVSWELPEGPFSYYRWEIVDLQYDRTTLYGESEGVNASPKPLALATNPKAAQ